MTDIGLIFAWALTTYLVAGFFVSLLESYQRINAGLSQKIRDTLNEIIHQVNIESVGNQVFWFDRDDGEFLAQGKTIAEVVDVVKIRYPDHLFFVHINNSDYVISSNTHWKLLPV